MTTLTLSKAINEGLRKALEDDPKVVVMGEDVGKLGGVFRVTDGLQKDFGESRVVDTPLAESGIVGTAVGLALRGYRPVCEIQFDGFVFPAFDQIVSQLAKMRLRSQGRVAVPVVVRIPFGGGIGAVEHHSESPEALFAHVPGLKVVACSNAVDAYWMIQQAIASDDPVIFFEPKRRYWEKAEVDLDATPPSLHSAQVVRPGSTLTLVGYGAVLKTCLEAAAAAVAAGGGRRGAVGGVGGVRGRGARAGGVLPLAGGAGAARHRVRHALPAVQVRGRLPPGPRPGARRRRPLDGVLRCRR
jgi:pyruvate dehydrogenase E1 component beta subunit